MCNMTLRVLVSFMMPVELLQVEAGLTDLQQAYDQLHKDLAGARGADERRTLEEHVRSTPRSTVPALLYFLPRVLSLIRVEV